MTHPDPRPSVVLVCHEDDRLDCEGLASWLASTMTLSGLVVIRDEPARKWKAARREIRRVGSLRFADVIALRAYSRLFLAARDNEWKTRTLAQLRETYPADLAAVPRVVVADPNSDSAREFVASLEPDLMIARCKFILKPDVFTLPRVGTFVLHPGTCPEYRNAHGCFWALVNRDLDRVGMTLLRVDKGIDTGPIFLQASCPTDEVRESHIVIQYRVVLENLDAIGQTLKSLAAGADAPALSTAGRRSAVWGQPRLTDYLRWKWAARRLARTSAQRSQNSQNTNDLRALRVPR
jgi:folate-dependent phosphoribosylglycinamide formyltransferase PurN